MDKPSNQVRRGPGRGGRRHRFVAALLVAAMLGACDDGGGPGDAGATRPSGTGGPDQPAPGQQGGALGELTTVVEGLEVPWELAFADRDTILVSERPGRVRVVEGGRLRAEPVARFDVESSGESGLLGLALHPDFPRERSAYAYYTAEDGNRVVRLPVGDDLTFGAEEVLLDAIPGSPLHDGGGLAFGPDGMLYIATGDAREPDRAADRMSRAGKILRIRPDGSLPMSNPIPGSPVWTYGHRNPQGLAWDARGNLYASEHGPTGDLGLCCHDELNLIIAGHFYGWPFRAGMIGTDRGEPPVEAAAPVLASGEDTWAPAGITARTGPSGDTELFMANLRASNVLRVRFAAGAPSDVTAVDEVFSGVGRVRDATFGPDGCLYLTTSNRDGRGSPGPGDDRILRSCPEP